MDPISITLAMVSLTTAVKDMVELGEKIHKSFAKVSDNLRNARRVAEDIKEMVEEIKAFYEDHKDAVDNMNGFSLAVQGLLGKLRDFEASILPLLPRANRRRGLFIREWWNNNKIEGRIHDLQASIAGVIHRYIMHSAMRTEVKLATVHRETSRGLVDVNKGISQGFEVIRRDISKLQIVTTAAETHCSCQSSGTTSDDFNRSVVMFAKSTPSTSAPLLRTPNVITEELMTTAYIKFQINSIGTALERMSKLPARALNVGNLEKVEKIFEMSMILGHASMNITRLRHHVVRQVTCIRDLLECELMQASFVRDGASALSRLAVGLKALGMAHECTLACSWATTLARMLVDASNSGQHNLSADLALYLLNQSIQYHCSDDKTRSLQTIGEAYAITHKLGLDRQLRGEVDVQILYSSVLLQFAELVDTQRSIEMSIEGIQVLEGILHVQAFTGSELLKTTKTDSVIQFSSAFLECPFPLAPSSTTAIAKYAHALQRLGTYLLTDGSSESAIRLTLLAIEVRRKMVSIYGPEHRAPLAGALSLLLRGRIASYIPSQDLVNAADECIQLLRELVGNNPLYYARELVYVLWKKASTLAVLNRDTESIVTLQEATSIAEQIVQDSKLCAAALGHLSDGFRRLKRHDDAVRTGKLAITTHDAGDRTQATNYFSLSYDLQQLQRYRESAQVAQTSVDLYRHLAAKDPLTWMSYLSAALSNLAHCLAACGNDFEALIAWEESASMLNQFLNDKRAIKIAVIDQQRATLDIHSVISYLLEDGGQCLKVGLTTLQYLHRLSEIYGQNAEGMEQCFRNEFRYAYNMFRVGILQEAIQYIDHWVDIWTSKSEAIPKYKSGVWHASMIHLKASVLDAQGYTQQGLVAIRKVRGLFQQSFTFDECIVSMAQEARLRLNLGNTEQALQVAEEAFRLFQDKNLELHVDNLLWSLHAIALAALSHQNYRYASEAARAGCDISASPEWQQRVEEHNAFIRPSLFAILSAAEANLGRFVMGVEYAQRAVSASLEIREMKSHISSTAADQSYTETRGRLAEVLIAAGDITQARQICQEQREYFSKRVVRVMGEYRDFAPILRMLGILCCSEGRHEEGNNAARELSRIMDMLGTVFPNLQEQVKIRLFTQARTPILKVLDEMSQRLDCGHQGHIMSFLEI